MSQLKLESPDFKDGDRFDDSYRSDMDNLSPALKWSGAPEGTKSFAVLCHDKDAPTGGAGWWHWVLLNIPANVTELPRGAGLPDGSKLPKGAIQLKNDGGSVGYMGCYPPKEDDPHEYKFTVYALDKVLEGINPNQSASSGGFQVNASAIAKASICGFYGWPK